MVKERKNVLEVNGVKYIPLSKSQAEWISAEKGEEIIVMDDEGKHGRFLSVWNEKQQEELKKTEE